MTELSLFALNDLASLRKGFRAKLFGTVICSFAVAVVTVFPDSEPSVLSASPYPRLFWSSLILLNVAFFFRFWRWYKWERAESLRRNEIDYHHSVALQRLFAGLGEKPAAAYGYAERECQPHEVWRPYRVEYLHGSSMHLVFDGTSVTGSSIPDTKNGNVVVFLCSGERTLRVIIPSIHSVTQKFVQCIEREYMPYRYTHVDSVLASILSKSLSYEQPTQVIDALALACQNAKVEERPRVHVVGQSLGEGIALASGLEVGNVTHSFFPSGFFVELERGYKGALESPVSVALTS